MSISDFQAKLHLWMLHVLMYYIESSIEDLEPFDTYNNLHILELAQDALHLQLYGRRLSWPFWGVEDEVNAVVFREYTTFRSRSKADGAALIYGLIIRAIREVLRDRKSEISESSLADLEGALRLYVTSSGLFDHIEEFFLSDGWRRSGDLFRELESLVLEAHQKRAG